MDLMVHNIVVESTSPSHMEMTAEIGCLTTFLRELLPGGYYMDYHWEHYGTITTTNQDQMMNLHAWFRSRTPITEDQLFGYTALLGAGV